MSNNILTQKQLKSFLSYSSETGIFIWLPCRGAGKTGFAAGTPHTGGYINITVNKKRYYAHRLAWLYIHGVWPKHQIDHINHIRDDNRIENLREVTNQENHKNSSLRNDSASGITGVSWCNTREKWRSHISEGERFSHLGYFTDKFEAICSRKSAENKHGFHENHGR